LAQALPNTSNEDRAVAINYLLQHNRIQLLGTADNPHFRAIAPAEAAKFRGLGQEEMLVYQTIANAANNGIWTRDMKAKTNLPQAKITKYLKTLEERALIKSVKSVQNANRKVYMLFELEPAKTLTGGPWYGDDQHIDTAFIEMIRTVALRKLAISSMPLSVEDITRFIIESEVSHQVLQEEDVAHVLTTLRYDGDVEEVLVEGDNQTRYRLQPGNAPESTPFGDLPCGVCPVFNECHEGGVISPEGCDYYTEWLKKFDF
jgi:DNA-directed RNA polymerase III subunit RPC6